MCCQSTFTLYILLIQSMNISQQRHYMDRFLTAFRESKRAGEGVDIRSATQDINAVPSRENASSSRRYCTRAATAAVGQTISIDRTHNYELQPGDDQFVQCDRCGKWRKLPLKRNGSLAVDISDESLFPETYCFCSYSDYIIVISLQIRYTFCLLLQMDVLSKFMGHFEGQLQVTTGFSIITMGALSLFS